MVIIRLILIGILFSLAVSCSTSTDTNKKSDVAVVDTVVNGPEKTIIETKRHKEFDSIPQTQISSPTFPLEYIFGVWTTDPDGPHAYFRLDSNSFYIVDYDGNGNMPYILHGDSLTIFYDDFISKNKIRKADKDSLILENEYGLIRNARWTN